MSQQQIKTQLERAISEVDAARKDAHIQQAIGLIEDLIDKAAGEQEPQLTWQEKEIMSVFKGFKCTPGQMRSLDQIIIGTKGRVPPENQLDA